MSYVAPEAGAPHLVIPSLSIDRGVMKNTKDTKLAFVRSVPEQARQAGLNVHANLGMSAIELVRKGEMLALMLQYPWLKLHTVQERIAQLSRGNIGGMNNYRTFELGGADVYTVPNEPRWIGLQVLDEDGVLAGERGRVMQVLSDIVHEDIDYVADEEFFLNVGVIDTYSDQSVDSVLDYIDQRKPQSVDVYDVAARPGNLFTAPSLFVPRES